MYDPEKALERERAQAHDQTLLYNVEESLGVDHPWTQRIRLVVDIIETLDQKQNDLENCTNSSEREKIYKEMDELIAVAREVAREALKG